MDDFDPKNEKLNKLKKDYESTKSCQKPKPSEVAAGTNTAASTDSTNTAEMVGEKLKELKLAAENAAEGQDTSAAGAAAGEEPATPKHDKKTPAAQKSTGKRNQGKGQGSGQGSRHGQSTAKKQSFVTLKDLCAADSVKKNLFKDVPEEAGEEAMCSEETDEVKQRMQSVPDNLLLRTGKVGLLLQFLRDGCVILLLCLNPPLVID